MALSKRHFRKNIPSTKLRIYNITTAAALKYVSEVWALNKNGCQQQQQHK
jgi:hypothetical protein